MKAILYIGHGTRSKKGAEEARGFINRVMQRVEVPIQEISFLELTVPLIEDGFRRCVEKGATEIIVVPIFLLAAGHIKQDIPQVLASLREKFPQIQVVVKNPFGVQERILDAVSEIVRSISIPLNPEDCLLIVGRGSSDPSIMNDFVRIQNGLKERLGLEEVSVCYLAAAEPRLQEGLNTVLEKTSGNIIVVPYLLFSGLLSAEVSREVQKWKRQGRSISVTEPLSRHQVIEDVVMERATL
ncbi:sirohydrochlorin chelatase [Neobacillus mesonae]|uniref:sirohydrochlorin chelatase n=1 Tax=Neobacillus mesonae TaxID=1193713 RepID=UPI002E1AECD3|nr:sirohydrochlorin chelatase [Neobacillus mesonae]